jgi:hypothetical protein
MDRKEAQWLNETEGKTFEQLSDSGEERYHHLDALLAEALVKVLPKGLMMRVQQKEIAALRSNNCITGRQVLRMVYDWLRTDEHMSLVYGHAGLMEIPWMGDRAQDMQKFLGVWGSVSTISPRSSLTGSSGACCTGACCCSVALKEDLAHFRREKAKGEGAENYTYSFLRKSIERFIANDRQDKNLADRQHALRQAASGKAGADLAANQAAPAQKAKEKEKTKGQGDRSGSAKRSPSPTDKKAGKGKGKPHADKCYFYNIEIRGLGSGCRQKARTAPGRTSEFLTRIPCPRRRCHFRRGGAVHPLPLAVTRSHRKGEGPQRESWQERQRRHALFPVRAGGQV